MMWRVKRSLGGDGEKNAPKELGPPKADPSVPFALAINRISLSYSGNISGNCPVSRSMSPLKISP